LTRRIEQDVFMAKTAVAAAGAIGILAAATVPGATLTANLVVQASVVDNCVVSATSLAFPAYTSGGGAVNGTSTITLRCTNGAQYGVGLSVGSTAGTSYAQRLLANGANTLQYNLYTSSSDAAVWGDGSAGTQIVSGISTGFSTPISLTVYGRIPDSAANQAATPGAYSDTILVVMTY